MDDSIYDQMTKDAEQLINFSNHQQQEIEKLEQQVEDMKKKIDEFRSTHPDDAEISNSNLTNDDLLNLHMEKEELEKDISKKEKYINDIKERIADQEESKKITNEKLKKAKEELKEVKTTNDHLKQSLQEIESSIQEKERLIKEQKSGIEQKSAENIEKSREIKFKKSTIKAEIQSLNLNTSYSFKESISHDNTIFTGIEFSSLLSDYYNVNDFYITCSRSLSKYDFSKRKEVQKINLNDEPIAFHIEPSSNYIAISTEENTYFCDYNLDDSSLRTMKCEQTSFTDNCWLSRNQILTSSRDGRVLLYNYETERIMSAFLLKKPIKKLCYLGNQKYFIAVDDKGNIDIIDIRQKDPISTTSIIENKEAELDICTDSFYEKIYVLEHNSNSIHGIDLQTMTSFGKLTHDTINEDNLFTSLSVGPFGNLMAAGTSNGSIIAFDISNGFDGDNANVLIPKSSHKKKANKPITCLKIGPNKLISTNSTSLAIWENKNFNK